MNFKKILSQLNIIHQCRKHNLSLWQCPQFLFLIMGFIIIAASVLAYLIGTRYIADPELVALMVLMITGLLFIVAFSVIRGFERLAEANRMKTEFISIISHQLRSPLSNLGWVIELLMSGRVGSISKNQLEYFGILKENTIRMKTLVKDLLTVSRIETESFPLKKEKVSLKNLTEEVISEFELLASASNVKIYFQAEENLPQVFIDRLQVRQVIENLLDNAIRYIRGKGRVEINFFKKKDKIYFEVKDNGVGIPEEDQKYIFQKFFRSKNILKYQTEGSGLGLYIAKFIIEKSGGRIGFWSQEGKGSTFWLTLPIK